jgi:sRNA-binding regulator protein Hfq
MKKSKVIYEIRPESCNNKEQQTRTLISVYSDNGLTMMGISGGCAFFDILLTKDEKEELIYALQNTQ